MGCLYMGSVGMAEGPTCIRTLPLRYGMVMSWYPFAKPIWDFWIKKNTQDKFGPVRSVTPTLVFEIGFEGINPSPRHKSGVALRFPRILRWRHDKGPREANTKDDL